MLEQKGTCFVSAGAGASARLAPAVRNGSHTFKYWHDFSQVNVLTTDKLMEIFSIQTVA